MRYKKKLRQAWEGGRTMAAAGHGCDHWYLDRYLQAAFDAGYAEAERAHPPAPPSFIDNREPLDLEQLRHYWAPPSTA